MLNKIEKEVVQIIINELENIFKYHNKNLTKKQYYIIGDCVECLQMLMERKKNEKNIL